MDKFENEKKNICKEIDVFITKATEENEMNIVKKLIHLKKIIYTIETPLEFMTEPLEENVINIRIRRSLFVLFHRSIDLLNNNLILEITREYFKLHGLDMSIFKENDIDQIIGLRFRKPKKSK